MLATPIRVRPLLGGVLLTILAACSGDNPAGPDDGGDDTPPEALSIASPAVRTLQVVTVGVRGVTIAGQTVDGRFGSQAIKGARLDDTTVAVVVPQVAAGEHELRLVVGAQAFATKLQVTAAPPVANPDAYFADLFSTLTSEATEIEQALEGTPAGTAASDTIGLRAIAVKLRWAADSGRKIVTGMSAADRATAAVYFAANTDAAPAASASPLAGGPSFATAGCDGGTVAECNAELRAAWERLKAKIASCTLSAVKFGAAGAILGGISGVGAFSVPLAALGAVVGSTLAGAVCVYQINDDAMQTITVPAITNLEQAIPSSLVAYDVVPATAYYRVKSPRKVKVTAEVRSLIAADASLPGIEGTIARLVNECAALWGPLVAKAGVSLPGPKLPQTPANRVVRDMPALLLKIGTISLAGVTATTAGDDTSFSVTFANDKQGADHQFTYAVRYEPEGRPAQEKLLAGVLRPERYVVAGLKVDSVPSEMRVGQGTVKLHWTARDSTGTYLGASGVDSLLNGRKPQWTSDKPDVASVDANGVITARAEGNVTITAKLEDGAASVSFQVYPNVFGAWTLQTLNGKQVPYEEADSLGVTRVGGGTIVLSPDSTFTFGYGETWTANSDGKVWNEGASGHGTFVLRGNSIVFTILEKSGEKVEELVGASFSDGVLTVTYSGSEGAATGRLTKN